MKKMKRIAALLMAAVMTIGASQMAMADQGNGDISLISLSITTAVQDGRNIPFYSNVTDYTYNVQSDCYGVKVTAVRECRPVFP